MFQFLAIFSQQKQIDHAEQSQKRKAAVVHCPQNEDGDIKPH